MKLFQLLSAVLLCSVLFSVTGKSEVIFVSSQQEFTDARNRAVRNDTIAWRTGTYADIRMDINNDKITVMAERLGSVIFNGFSRAILTGDSIVFEGFQYLGGRLGPQDIIDISGSHITITQININEYTCNKYLRVREESQYVNITHCNFENRLNLIDQNILSILVDGTNPGFHKIQYCSFKNFDGTGNDMGIEPIRIGVSTQADFASRSVVEYCYFTRCNGDGEIISSKASQNVYRHNTFEDNPLSELVLRHGSDNIVYGNFFINGKGGVRVREGQNHYIYNNYFYELDDRAIFLQNDDSDRLDNINVAFNTIINCAEVILGGTGSDQPTNVTIANNIISDPIDNNFNDATGSETFIGNIAFGDLGITTPASGITLIDPELEVNSEGFFGLSSTSPAINAAQPGYVFLPQFMGIDSIDSEILFDLMRQDRPVAIPEKDLGSNEFPHTVLIQPIATESNTGPSYSTVTSVKTAGAPVADFIEINPNPVSDKLNIEVDIERGGRLTIHILDASGRILDTITEENISEGKSTLVQNVGNLPSGLYTVRASIKNLQNKLVNVQTVKLVKM